MKTSTLIIILIGIVLIVSTHIAKKKSLDELIESGELVNPSYSYDFTTETVEGVATGALAKKNEDDEGDDDNTAGIKIISMFLKPQVIIMIGILLMFVMGGGNFLFSNPILIFFAVIMFIVMRWKK